MSGGWPRRRSALGLMLCPWKFLLPGRRGRAPGSSEQKQPRANLGGGFPSMGQTWIFVLAPRAIVTACWGFVMSLAC